MQLEKTRWRVGPPSKKRKCSWKHGYATPQTEEAGAWPEWRRQPKKQNAGFNKEDISWKDRMSVLKVDHHGKLVTIDQHTKGRRTRALKAGHHRTRVGHHGRLDIVIHHRVTDLKAGLRGRVVIVIHHRVTDLRAGLPGRVVVVIHHHATDLKTVENCRKLKSEKCGSSTCGISKRLSIGTKYETRIVGPTLQRSV